ncbi:hypothetical protein ONZ45_g1162 [Pleurotus djamor]|nr:hypothetical protein ONZ45_g1162 [Pleurotus djamor]
MPRIISNQENMDPNAATPGPRIRKQTAKQQEITHAKEQRQQTAALRAAQQLEEENDFDQDRLPAESEDDDGEDGEMPTRMDTEFHVVTASTPVTADRPRTVVRNGRVLTFRAPPHSQMPQRPARVTTGPYQKRNLVRRATRIPPTEMSTTMPLAQTPAPATRHSQHEDLTQDPNEYNENYFDHERSYDDEPDPAPVQVPPHPSYPNAHPDFESFSQQVRQGRYRERQDSPPPEPAPEIRSHKRPASSQHSVNVQESTVIKRARLTFVSSGSRGRTKGSDINGPGKQVLELSFTNFRAFVSTDTPFPTHDEINQVIVNIWCRSCKQIGVLIEFEEAVSLLVGQRGPQMRGELKTKARPIVELTYGLRAEDDRIKMREHVERLLSRYTFVFRDTDTRTGMYMNDIIQTIVNKVWFSNRKADGVKHPSFSDDDGIPLITIALVLTVVENVLDEWLTGEHVDMPFSAHNYRDKYHAHLQTLRNFQAHAPSVVLQLRKRLLTQARRYAKVDEASAEPRPGLNADDFETALQEWRVQNTNEADVTATEG